MALVTLLLRDLRSGDRMTAEFETLDSCREWLMARPEFVDVLGPINEELSPEGDQLLRTAVRPYSAAERALLDQLRQEREAEERKEADRRQKELEAANTGPTRQLGPDDPMTIAWEHGSAARNADPLDPRPVPRAVVDALAGWLAERNSWVIDRGQVVCAAHVTVWPGKVPAGAERIHEGGRFEVR
ncbi:MAG: hypothetical protein JW751_24520 [Polyangiaceae bacterium]|nr:hypothetical protein [Polyangiaceae bacterium]